MTDVHTPARRSKNMQAIRSKNTSPERQIRRLLFARGLRFRLHARHLPGVPDIVLPKYRAVIFIHGCFWHGHECHLFVLPQTRRAFWQDKITANRQRDLLHAEALTRTGWRVLTVWECALKGRLKWDPAELGDCITTWIRCGNPALPCAEIRHR